jgi:hypothetical protein
MGESKGVCINDTKDLCASTPLAWCMCESALSLVVLLFYDPSPARRIRGFAFAQLLVHQILKLT